MSLRDDFISGDGPHLVEASAGTGKTTWMVRTAVQLLLQGAIHSPERLLAVTFTRAATAELKERLRRALQRVNEIREGASPSEHEAWMRVMLDAGGDTMANRLDITLKSLDRLAVTTIHGFCKGVLEEFALECGVPLGMRFIDDDRDYFDEAAADEWRALTWAATDVSHFVIGERMSGVAARRKRWDPAELMRAARVVSQSFGVARPARIDRDGEMLAVKRATPLLLNSWNEERVRAFHRALTWNKNKGITEQQFHALCAAMQEVRDGGDPAMADILRWARSVVSDAANKKGKGVKARLDSEPFLDACEQLLTLQQSVNALLWQDAILAVTDRVNRAMERDHVAGFDEMIALVQRAVADANTGAAIRRELAGRYDAVLVDEFQDTDWAQWSIFATTFSVKPLVLVGDPKQSIYGFRGADITAYRQARDDAKASGDGRVGSLDTNYRSDEALVDATEVLFRCTSAPFGVPGATLDFEHVTAFRAKASLEDSRLRPLVLIDLGKAASPEQDKTIVRVVGREVARLLGDSTVRYQGENDREPRPLKPSDIAVLVSANHQAAPLLKALHTNGVPAVSGSTGDITESATWRDVLMVIGAIDDPSDARRVRRALATSLGGQSAKSLVNLEEKAAAWRALLDRLEKAGRDWRKQGVLSALVRLTNEWGTRAFLAGQVDGERRLTDFRHVVSLLQDAERQGHRNPTLLLSWARAFARERGEERERRQPHLESDEQAVTISTMHGAKGLEWPIVFCCYLWKEPRERESVPRVARFADGTRRLVFNDEPEGELEGDSALSEDLRLAYVALTRAKSRTYVVYANASKGKGGAIQHLLQSVAAGDQSPASVLAAAHPELIARASEADLMEASRDQWRASSPSPESPVSARRVRILPVQTHSWTVSSYTRLIRDKQESPELGELGPVDVGEAAIGEDARADQLPGGAETGIALHDLLERFDFPMLADTELVDAAIGDVLTRYSLPRPSASAAQRDAALGLVRRMMTTTIGTPIPGVPVALATVAIASTLREWRFNLTMKDLSAKRLANVFQQHGTGWIADSYAPMLRRVPQGEISGFLTGVVDLIAQLEGRWWIVDWKSNTLGPTAEYYGGPARQRVMAQEDYVLQYHLYVVALHRFLKKRLGSRYDYSRDFGGIGYAFLRGLAMGAPAWFTDRPSVALIAALDDCIGGYVQ